MDTLVSNRRAFHDYEILESFEAGMILLGTEVKSLRTHQGSLQDAYVFVNDAREVILKNSSIPPYKFGNLFNHEERRERKLLFHKREIERMKTLSQEKGLTLVPLEIYLLKGRIKIKVGIGRGKKAYDKRASLKEKEHRKEMRDQL